MTYALINNRTKRVEQVAILEQDIIKDDYAILKLDSNFKPVVKARIIFAGMQGKTRKEIMEVCGQSGINHNTAAVQFSKWKQTHA